MPIYEYECGDCTRQFELLVRGAEVPACPECASTSLEKLISGFAVGSDARAGATLGPESCNTCGDPRGPGS